MAILLVSIAPTHFLHISLAGSDGGLAVVLRLLELIHEALRNDVVISKRYLASMLS